MIFSLNDWDLIGEGGKSKGIYFGNNDPSLLRRFFGFVETKIGLNKRMFKATIKVPNITSEKVVKENWSRELSLPIQNFTRTCVDPRINREYTQVYFNSILLADLMKKLYANAKEKVITNPEFCTPFLRGIFAAEGSVLLKKSGVLHHISFSSKDLEIIHLLEKGLQIVYVAPSEYMLNGMNLQIYGRRNFERILELGIHTLHPEKREKFERGFAAYKRIDVLDGEEARHLILQQLATGPKTYDELAAALGKARTTIQSHHIPILEKQGLVKRAGKRGQAWTFELR